jgi:hypothetical protein
MIELLLAFVVMVLIILAMSVGVILAGKPIKGSCGGIAALGMATSCDICGGNPAKCDEQQSDKVSPQAIAYDATRRS